MDRTIINGPSSSGPVDGMSVTPAGGAETRTLSGWLGDLSGALTYVPTLGAKLTLAQWLEVPARPQWWNAKCDGATLDTTAMRKAVTGSAAAGLTLRVTGTCLTGMIDVPSNARIVSEQAGTLKLSTPIGPLLRIAAGANGVVIRGMTFDATSLDAADVDAAGNRGLPGAVIYQTPGIGGGTIRIVDNRFLDIYEKTQSISAIILNGAISYVTGNYVAGTGGDALNFNGGFNHVSGNVVARSGDGCIAFNNGARGVVTGNTLMKCELGFGAGPEGSAFDADQAQSMVFANNTVEASDYGVNMGWFRVAGRTSPVNWVVANNVFRNIRSVAINYDGHAAGFAANGAVTGNVIWRTGAATYNGTKAATPVDIRIVNGGGVTVSSNTLRDSLGTGRAGGIFAQGSPNIAITGNSIAQSGANQYDSGIFIYDTQYSAVSGNVINGALIGIKLDQSALADYVSTITGNTLLTILYAGVSVGGAGGSFNINGNTMISVGPGTPTAGVVIDKANNDFSVQNNLIRWRSGVAISNPAGRTWARYLVGGNNTGGGTVPN
ncbi:right-handed parallel beta-helix repeat-containing protein [Methylobacterium sp. yr668]|uniref:NosD domain-containing protein n=1 Tax=Methylobacterium sp. yr668 TaxID=1761801 RepID=UPI0011147F79|nr:right-handed parallel beta-helix repeat-containing protein [Methylobacterium sp. yr668]